MSSSNTNFNVLASNIKKYRNQLNMSQKELGEAINKSEISIRKYESGQNNIPFDTLNKLSSTFKVSIYNLLGTDFKFYCDKNKNFFSLINKFKNKYGDSCIENFGKFFKHIRNNQKLPLDKLSNLSNVPKEIIINLEENNIIPNMNVMRRLLFQFDIPTKELNLLVRFSSIFSFEDLSEEKYIAFKIDATNQYLKVKKYILEDGREMIDFSQKRKTTWEEAILGTINIIDYVIWEDKDNILENCYLETDDYKKILEKLTPIIENYIYSKMLKQKREIISTREELKKEIPILKFDDEDKNNKNK